MSLVVDPDEGQFVFGAYARHLDQGAPLSGPADSPLPPPDPGDNADDGELGSIAC